jgi:uncharacterized protein (DUF58 family)
VHSIYPLGFFYAWLYLPTDAVYYIYPKPSGHLPLPKPEIFSSDSQDSNTQKGGDDFSGHRLFQPGDSSRRIDWKAFARGRPLLAKEFNLGSPFALHFKWAALAHLSTEDRLSQMAMWIELAHRKDIPYGLEMPWVSIEPNIGLLHYHRCLQELAIYDEDQNHDQAS